MIAHHKIRQARKIKGMSQATLADMSGISHSIIAKLESGVIDETTTSRSIAAIAKILNIDHQSTLPNRYMKGVDFSKGFKFIDLFAGIGGIRLAMQEAGGTCVFSSEWDKQAQNTYEDNFGERPHGDITKIQAKDIPEHDLLAAGFPCQSFSIIGERKGFADTRGTLFFDIERILRENRPYAILLENVKNLVSHDQGRTFRTIIFKLEELGYHVYWKVLNGLNFGIPQKRERIVIVGFLEDLSFEFPAGGNRTRLKLEDILENDQDVDPSYFLSEKMRNKYKNKTPPVMELGRRTIWHENKSGNIGIHDYSCALRANASYNYLTVDGKRRLTGREMIRLQGFPDTFRIPDSYAHTRQQAGNSVVVPQFIEVAKSIVQSIALKNQSVNTTSKITIRRSYNTTQLELAV